jgi:hypothetical protein
VSNSIFRAGGAAMLMTNKPSLYSRCKYELHSSTRVHTGQDDTAYRRAIRVAARVDARARGSGARAPCGWGSVCVRVRATRHARSAFAARALPHALASSPLTLASSSCHRPSALPPSPPSPPLPGASAGAPTRRASTASTSERRAGRTKSGRARTHGRTPRRSNPGSTGAPEPQNLPSQSPETPSPEAPPQNRTPSAVPLCPKHPKQDVPIQAGKMLEAVISAATPKIMTWGQYAEAATNIIGRKVLGLQWPRCGAARGKGEGRGGGAGRRGGRRRRARWGARAGREATP